jgi:hypothetical protein
MPAKMQSRTHRAGYFSKTEMFFFGYCFYDLSTKIILYRIASLI